MEQKFDITIETSFAVKLNKRENKITRDKYRPNRKHIRVLEKKKKNGMKKKEGK